MSTTRAPCPACNRGPRDTALAISTDERGTVSYCHRCHYVAADSHTVRPVTPLPARRAALDWSDHAQRIWDRTRELRGSLGEIYLRHRGCVLPPVDGDLRFLPGDDRYPPTLCARITDVMSARPISLHFTRLRPDGLGKAGTAHDKLLLRGHRKSGGCIRLWPDEAVTHGLALAEGIETALAAAHVYTPIWSAIDAGNLGAFPVLPAIESLTVFADHDDPGLQAARDCGRRWFASGRAVRIRAPKVRGLDVADLVAA